MNGIKQCIHGNVIFRLPYVKIMMIVQLSGATVYLYLYVFGPWTILARKDQNTLIEQSVTLIEQLLFLGTNIVKVSKWYLKCDDLPGASP